MSLSAIRTPQPEIQNCPAWFCLQTSPKQESKVATLLQREVGAEVYAPKIRFRRSRAGRPIWWTEALFPGYVFARFDYFAAHRQIRAIAGVSTIVRYGQEPAPLSDEAMASLREAIGPDDTVEIGGVAEPASEVVIIDGPLRGLQVLVTRVLPARQRVAVLLEFLGQEREVEIDAESVIPANPRAPSGAGSFSRR